MNGVKEGFFVFFFISEKSQMCFFLCAIQIKQGPLGEDKWLVLNLQWRSDQAHFFFPLVTSARLISRSHQLKWKSYYYRAWSRADISAMNEAVSGLGNSNNQARDTLYMERDTSIQTNDTGLSLKIRETYLRRTDFFPKVLIGMFGIAIILSLFFQYFLKPLIFCRFPPAKLTIFLRGKFRENILKTFLQSKQDWSCSEQINMEIVAWVLEDVCPTEQDQSIPCVMLSALGTLGIQL